MWTSRISKAGMIGSLLRTSLQQAVIVGICWDPNVDIVDSIDIVGFCRVCRQVVCARRMSRSSSSKLSGGLCSSGCRCRRHRRARIGSGYCCTSTTTCLLHLLCSTLSSTVDSTIDSTIDSTLCSTLSCTRRSTRRSPKHSLEHSLDASSTCRDQAAYSIDTQSRSLPLLPFNISSKHLILTSPSSDVPVLASPPLLIVRTLPSHISTPQSIRVLATNICLRTRPPRTC